MRLPWLLCSALIGISVGLACDKPVAAQGQAGAPWQDSSGDFVVTVMDRLGRSCASGTAQASYQMAGGSGGFLYPDDCDDNSGQYRFEDTEGAERCVGTSTWETVSPTVRDTTWVIEAPVSGFPCSTSGQVYNIRLYFAEAPAMTGASGSSAVPQVIEWTEVENALEPSVVGRNTIARQGSQITFDAIADSQYVRYDGNCQTSMLYPLKTGTITRRGGQPTNVRPAYNPEWFQANEYLSSILLTACALSE